jgi:hypothetical protein
MVTYRNVATGATVVSKTREAAFEIIGKYHPHSMQHDWREWTPRNIMQVDWSKQELALLK